MAWIIIALIFIFVFGSIAGLQLSGKEKAQGELRDKARKMGLHPRLVPAPDWVKLPESHHTAMVAYYSVLIADGKFPLMRAIVQDQTLTVITGQHIYNGQHVTLPHLYAIDMQANCIGVYWNENADLAGEHLQALKDYLYSFRV